MGNTSANTFWLSNPDASWTWTPPEWATNVSPTSIDWSQIQSISGTELSGLQTVVCMVCGDKDNEDGVVEQPGLCELCRQAILKFRAMVLEEMARDLEKMMSD